MDKLSQVNK